MGIQKMIFKVIFFILAYSATKVTSLEVQCTLYKLNYPANLTNDGTIKFGVYDSQHYPAPSEDCKYEVFDMLKNNQVENNSYAIYNSSQNVLELINVETETPYILKQDGKNMSKLITVLTSNRNQFTQILNVTSDSSPQNVSFSISQRFLSYLLIKGIENLKIDDFRYKYGREKSDLKIEIGVQEKKLYLELGPSFNYKKEHKLFISLHSESYEIIILKFNVLPEAVEAP